MGNIVRFALVGAGSMGRNNGRRIVADGRGRIVAVADPDKANAALAAKEFGAKAAYGSVEALLKSKTAFDAAVVSTTNITHAPVSIALLNAGKSVYCEKPLAYDAAAAAAVVEAERNAKGVFMVGYNQRFDPWAQYAKDQIEKGRLGRIYHAQTQWHRRLWIATFGRWFTDKKISGGGPLIDIGVHRLDQTLWLMGCPRALSVSAVTYDALAKGVSKRLKKSYSVEEFAAALIRLEGGASILLQASYLSYLPLEHPEMSTLLMGTACGFYQSGQSLRIVSNKDLEPSDTILQTFPKPKATVMGHFIDCVLTGRKPMCTAEQGLAVARILDAIYQSAASGEEVTL